MNWTDEQLAAIEFPKRDSIKLPADMRSATVTAAAGSGKTALAYHNVRYLRDYYQKQGKVAKFYFIVDRLDLLTQAGEEFTARGLHVEKVNSKEEFINYFQYKKLSVFDSHSRKNSFLVNEHYKS